MLLVYVLLYTAHENSNITTCFNTYIYIYIYIYLYRQFIWHSGPGSRKTQQRKVTTLLSEFKTLNMLYTKLLTDRVYEAFFSTTQHRYFQHVVIFNMYIQYTIII